MNQKTVTIIGAGIGGLSAAIHLARQGMKVTVIEKNARPGGRCDRLSREGHTFDTGPTLLVMSPLYEAEFARMGVQMQEVLDLQRVDPTYHLVFDDGSRLTLTSDMQSMREQLEAIQPGSFQGLLRYLEEGRRHYELGIEKLVYPDFRSPFDFFKPGNLPLLHQVKPLRKHFANMGHYFDDPRLKAAFTFQDVYMGLSPFEAPATFSMMPYTELAHGVWYPRGGMYRVVEALSSLALDAGVAFAFNTTVERITVDDDRAQGVVVDGEQLEADAILANADLPYVYQKLLPADGQSKKLAGKRYSCSVISFFWGVDRRYEALPPHTLFLSDDYRANFDSIMRDLTLPENPSLYIHAPSRLDPGMAPDGQDTLIAIVPVGHESAHGEQDWAALRDRARQEVFRHLRSIGIHDLAEHIKFEINFIPPSWGKRYNLVKGATHGLCHNLTQLGYFRPDLQHARYHNLFFAGASTRPGTGMPSALISGRQAAQRILDDWRN
jgi:phytoene desaturase